MKPKVFVTAPISEEVESYLSKYCEYRIWRGKEPIPKEILLKEVKDIDGLLTPKGKIDNELLEHSPKLKVVSNIAVGYDSFDLEEMRRRKVYGTHTPYVLDETVADLVFGLILSSARRISELDSFVKNGEWGRSEKDFFGVDVHHATLGIVGMGRVGEKIARRASLGFDMDVLYYNRSQKFEVEEELSVTYCNLESLLKESDFIVLMLPLTSQTQHIIGEKEFDMMKSNAIFVNCSRGKTVDESALVSALQEGKIHGAGLDVFEQEPIDPDNPLLNMKNVVTLPHIGSATRKTREDMQMLAAKNVVAGVTGKIPPNVVKELQDNENLQDS